MVSFLHLVSVLVCFSKIHFSKLVHDGHLKEKLVKKGRVDPFLFPGGLIKVFLGFPGKPPWLVLNPQPIAHLLVI